MFECTCRQFRAKCSRALLLNKLGQNIGKHSQSLFFIKAGKCPEKYCYIFVFKMKYNARSMFYCMLMKKLETQMLIYRLQDTAEAVRHSAQGGYIVYHS